MATTRGSGAGSDAKRGPPWPVRVYSWDAATISDEGLRCGLVPAKVVADLQLERYNEGPEPCSRLLIGRLACRPLLSRRRAVRLARLGRVQVAAARLTARGRCRSRLVTARLRGIHRVVGFCQQVRELERHLGLGCGDAEAHRDLAGLA
jgi:hypothetical protein